MNKADNRYTINENDRKKVLDHMKLGIWRMEFVPDQLPRLYGDTNMYAILGAEPQMQPEQLYQYWRERIEPAYLFYVQEAAERLGQTGQPVEVEYIWNHPQHGRMLVRGDAALSSQDDSGKMVMLGTYRDITYKLENNIDQLLFAVQDIQNEYRLKKLKEENEDVLYSVIHDRSVIYKCDTELQQFQLLKHDAQNIGRSVASAKMSLPELAEKMCAHYVDPSAWPEVKTFLSYENIRNCVVENSKKFISFPLDAVHFQYDYAKISIFPSLKSKTKAYLVMELMDRKERLHPILESYIRDTVDYFYCIDLKTDYFFQFIGNTERNGMPQEGYNYTQEMIRYADRFVTEEDRELVKKQMSPEFILKTLENKQEFSFVESIIGEHGEIRKKLLTYSPFNLSKGYVLLKRIDITDMYNRERMLEKAQQESVTDSLTKLYNRLGIERLIKKALRETDEKKNAALIMLDLDNFKVINDRFGHPAGDQILCEAAQKLKECFRTGDIIGRLGGDEYIIFLQNMSQKSDIYIVLKRVMRELNIVCKNEKESITVTVSAGAALCKGQSYEELYREADIALYHSKKKKNRYSLFENVE